MILRFTLNNATSGSLVIEEPDGWKEALLKLTRSEEFHSVIESYEEQTFTFWDASYDYLVNIRDTQGFDSDVTILIEISEDETTYETIFSGLVDIENSLEVDFKKIDCPIVRNDLWTRFNNNRGTSVDLQSTTDLYGNNRIVLSPVTINMTPQRVTNNYVGINNDRITYVLGASQYGIIDFGTVLTDDIEDKFNYPRVESTTVPFELFAFKYDGVYEVDCTLFFSTVALNAYVPGGTNVYFQLNDDAAIAFTITNLGVNGVNGRTRFTYSSTVTVNAGDFIRIYLDGASTLVWLESDYTIGDDSQLTVLGYNTYPQTTSQAIMIHEAFQSVLDRIIGANNTLYSEYIGAEDTQQTDYTSNGCASLCAIMKGLHIRQYTLSEKPFYASFNELWEGHNPIFNLGLGYETVDGTEVIRIEDKGHFYDSTVSINLDYVNNIEVSINTEGVYKNIKIGYQKWESENVPGIDDPQTKHEYAVALKKSGSEIDLQSKFIAASLAIEFTRRESVKEAKDWKLDNDTFIIAIDKDIIGSPALVYEPELGGPFSSVTNLENPAHRYNLTLTPGHNFLRWRNVFNSGLQLYTALDYKFVSGEGNVTMVSTVGTDSCISGTVTENQNFDITTDALYDNVIYSFEHPLTWTEYKTIRDNRHQAIGVSTTNALHEAFFIKSLEYSIHDALGKFRLVKAVIPVFEFQAELSASVSANWEAYSNGGGVIDTIILNSPSDSGNEFTILVSTNVEISCSKRDNTSIAEAAGDIKYYRNGILEPGTGNISAGLGTQTFILGANVTSSSYNFINVTVSDVLKVVITEG